MDDFAKFINSLNLVGVNYVNDDSYFSPLSSSHLFGIGHFGPSSSFNSLVIICTHPEIGEQIKALHFY